MKVLLGGLHTIVSQRLRFGQRGLREQAQRSLERLGAAAFGERVRVCDQRRERLVVLILGMRVGAVHNQIKNNLGDLEIENRVSHSRTLAMLVKNEWTGSCVCIHV